MKKIVGIYKITSPSGRVYIGQSTDIAKRWRRYKSNDCLSQKLLLRSFKKYGIKFHAFEVVHELPNDVDRSVIDSYEQLYMDQYFEIGSKMLNICRDVRGPGSINIGKKRSQEARERMALAKRGKPGNNTGKKHTEETKQIIKQKRATQIIKKGVKRKTNGNIGSKRSEETKKKMSDAKLGKKLSIEHLANRSESFKKNYKGRVLSEDHKRKIGLSSKGRVLSEEARKKVSIFNKGKIISEETKAKMSESARARYLVKDN